MWRVQGPKATPKAHQKHSKSRSKIKPFSAWTFGLTLSPFWLHFGTPWTPLMGESPQKGASKLPKTNQKGSQDGNRVSGASKNAKLSQNVTKIKPNLIPKTCFFNHVSMIVGLIFPAFRIAFRIDFRIDSHPTWRLTGLWPLASGL